MDERTPKSDLKLSGYEGKNKTILIKIISQLIVDYFNPGNLITKNIFKAIETKCFCNARNEVFNTFSCNIIFIALGVSVPDY